MSGGCPAGRQNLGTFVLNSFIPTAIKGPIDLHQIIQLSVASTLAEDHKVRGKQSPSDSFFDPYYLLTRREQVTVFRLRTGLNRLNYHLYSKLRIGYTEQCPCGADSQRTEHLLQSCPIYEPLRKRIWLDHTPVARKLYGSLGDLRCTATFIEETGVSI